MNVLHIPNLFVDNVFVSQDILSIKTRQHVLCAMQQNFKSSQGCNVLVEKDIQETAMENVLLLSFLQLVKKINIMTININVVSVNQALKKSLDYVLKFQNVMKTPTGMAKDVLVKLVVLLARQVHVRN